MVDRLVGNETSSVLHFNLKSQSIETSWLEAAKAFKNTIIIIIIIIKQNIIIIIIIIIILIIHSMIVQPNISCHCHIVNIIKKLGIVIINQT